jgi:farnesyl-diphosphate farnesyltransferase
MTLHKKQKALAFAKGIIKRVSRTFAISIKLLPGTLGHAVLTGYLLCRIADTIEDDSSTPSKVRQQLLTLFSDCLSNQDLLTQFKTDVSCIKGDESYLDLIKGSEMVFDLLNSLPEQTAQIVVRWTRELALGMNEFVKKYPKGIYIKTLDEFHQYCYYVAGTVGRMLTELFYYHSPFINQTTYNKLLVDCESFGEALQAVNILKDVAWDFEFENDVFIPEEILVSKGSSQSKIISEAYRAQNYEAVKVIIEVAQTKITKALEYFYTLPRMAITVRLFCLLPIVFAIATLREIERTQTMLQKGSSVKISRKEVKRLLCSCFIAVMSNKLTSKLVEHVSKKPW